MAQKKTNAMRLLEKLGIKYETMQYEDDKEHYLPVGAAGVVAQKLHIMQQQVFKTIVMQSDKKKIFIFCQNATAQINLKKARLIAGAKEIAPVPPKDLLSLTGYIRGGCSPLATKKPFPVFIDKSALMQQKIYVSAGVRGLQIGLAPQDLIKATGAVVCDLLLEA